MKKEELPENGKTKQSLVYAYALIKMVSAFGEESDAESKAAALKDARKALGYPEDKKDEEEKLLEMAISQFTGFSLCSKGGGVVELITSMGLSKSEWTKIRDNEPHGLNESQKEEVDEYFQKQ